MKEQIGWHFAGDTLRDGSPLPRKGDRLPTISNPIPCERGYHASPSVFDALQFAPGPYIARVRLSGIIVGHGSAMDKWAASDRETLTDYVDVSESLLDLARMFARDVLHLWDAPEIMRQYLTTGDESIRDVAKDAARDAMWGAPRAPSWTAACGAARAASWGGSAEEALKAAARDASWATAWAAYISLSEVKYPLVDVFRSSARAKAREKQRSQMEEMITAVVAWRCPLQGDAAKGR